MSCLLACYAPTCLPSACSLPPACRHPPHPAPCLPALARAADCWLAMRAPPPPLPPHLPCLTQVVADLAKYKPAELARVLWGFGAVHQADVSLFKAASKVSGLKPYPLAVGYSFFWGGGDAPF